jgi:hypothetical protein
MPLTQYCCNTGHVLSFACNLLINRKEKEQATVTQTACTASKPFLVSGNLSYPHGKV